MLGKEGQQDIDKNTYSKDTKEMRNVGDADKLTKWYMIMIGSIVYLALERVVEYLLGYQGMPFLADLSKLACLPISGIVFISGCVIIFLSKRRPDKKRKTISLLLIFAGIVTVFTIFASFQLLAPAGLVGLAARIDKFADIPSIRQWAASLDMPDDGYYWIKGKDLEQYTHVFKILKPGAVWVVEYVDEERDKRLYRVVNVGWGGMLGAWELSIGPPEIGEGRIPHNENVLQVESGVYVYLVFR